MSEVRYAARRDEPVEEGTRAPIKSWAKALWVEYEIDPEIHASVLPRPLSVGADPLLHMSSGKVDMESGASFGFGNITVRAAHGDKQGEYGLTMPMGIEAAVIGGRETFGEQKKIADCDIQRTGDDIVATITRNGITYAELRGRSVEKLAPLGRKETLDFYFKFMIDPSGKGFDNDPALVYCKRTYDIGVTERVEGEVILRDSPFDPIADIPVGRIDSFHYVEFESSQVAEIVDRVPGEWIAPFAHQRYDSFSWNR